MAISQFNESLHIRIDNLERKSRLMTDDSQVYEEDDLFHCVYKLQ